MDHPVLLRRDIRQYLRRCNVISPGIVDYVQVRDHRRSVDGDPDMPAVLQEIGRLREQKVDLVSPFGHRVIAMKNSGASGGEELWIIRALDRQARSFAW